MANVQIPEELFSQLCHYFLLGKQSDTKMTLDIEQGLEKKLEAIMLRELYTRSKEAKTKEEQNAARIEFLERKGIPEGFRW